MEKIETENGSLKKRIEMLEKEIEQLKKTTSEEIKNEGSSLMTM
jgi:cell division protein FtsB